MTQDARLLRVRALESYTQTAVSFSQSKRSVKGKWTRAHRIEAGVKEGLKVGQDTNLRVQKMETQLGDLHGLLLQQKFTMGSPETTAAQADTMIASLKQVRAAAKIASKAEAVEAKTKLAAAKAEAKTKAAAAKEEAKTKAAAAKAEAKAAAVRQIIRNR